MKWSELFSWKKKSGRLKPELEYILSFNSQEIRLREPNGIEHELKTSDLRGVAVETNDSGPWGMDFWWLLFGADDRIAIAYPQGATGEQSMLKWLVALQGFNHEQLSQAMRSTGNAIFPIWHIADNSKTETS